MSQFHPARRIRPFSPSAGKLDVSSGCPGTPMVSGAATAAIVIRRVHHLLGAEVGILYVAVAVALAWLVAWFLTCTGRPPLARAVTVAAVAVPIAAVMADPATVSPGLQHFIGQQATDREARRELAAVFATDPRLRRPDDLDGPRQDGQPAGHRGAVSWGWPPAWHRQKCRTGGGWAWAWSGGAGGCTSTAPGGPAGRC